MTQFEKRLAAVEAKAGMASNLAHRVYVQPADCPDVAAWERACEAEAARDEVQPIIVLFVKPSDAFSAGAVH